MARPWNFHHKKPRKGLSSEVELSEALECSRWTHTNKTKPLTLSF